MSEFYDGTLVVIITVLVSALFFAEKGHLPLATALRAALIISSVVVVLQIPTLQFAQVWSATLSLWAVPALIFGAEALERHRSAAAAKKLT